MSPDNLHLGPYLLGPNETSENGIYIGDARLLAKAIPDESVDLIFTDPIYQNIDDYRWLAETAVRVLKPDSSCLAFVAHARVISSGAQMLPFLSEGPILEHYVTGPKGRLFSHSIQCNVLPCLWFTKGHASNAWMCLQETSVLKGAARGHKWGKAIDMIHYRLSRFTKVGAVVWDPFVGGGTIPAVCKLLGRRYLAFEIVPATANLALQRVRQTQPPLFVPEPEQLPLDS